MFGECRGAPKDIKIKNFGAQNELRHDMVKLFYFTDEGIEANNVK